MDATGHCRRCTPNEESRPGKYTIKNQTFEVGIERVELFHATREYIVRSIFRRRWSPEKRGFMRSDILASVIFIILAAVGCHAQDQLGGRTWRVSYVRGVKLGTVTATVSFDPAAARFSGNTGCNIMNGTMSASRNSIKFSAAITTKRACTRTTAPVESGVLGALNRA